MKLKLLFQENKFQRLKSVGFFFLFISLLAPIFHTKVNAQAIARINRENAIQFHKGENDKEKNDLEFFRLLKLNIDSLAGRQEMIEAYRMIIHYYSELDSASRSTYSQLTDVICMRELLRISPEYRTRIPKWTTKTNVIDTIDLFQFKSLRQHFKRLPITFGFFTALTLPIAKKVTFFTLGDQPQDSSKYFRSPGCRLSLFSDYYFTPWLAFTAEAGFEELHLEKKYTPFPFTRVTYNESLRRFLFSGSLKFNYDIPIRGKIGSSYGFFTIAPRLGFAYGKVTKAFASASRLNEASFIALTTDSLPNITSFREKEQWEGFLGLSLGLKFNRIQIFLEARQYVGFTPWVKSETRYKNTALQFPYFYIDDDFKVNHFAASIGFSFSPFYRIHFKEKYDGRNLWEKISKNHYKKQKP